MDSINALSREDLTAFQTRWLRPDNLRIHVVGDTTLDALLPQLEGAFGDWRAPRRVAKGEKNLAEVALPEEPQVILVDRPGSPQTYILAGQVAPAMGSADELDIDAMNQVLAGNFVSRLNLNLREEKGWSYGVRSQLVDARGQRPLIIRAPVQTDRTIDSITEMQRELGLLLGEAPPTEDEIRRVKLDAVRSLPGSFETSRAVLGSMLDSARFDRPWNYPETLADRYADMTAADAASAAKRVLAPERLVWVIVGDAEKIEAGVRALELGDVEVRALSELWAELPHAHAQLRHRHFDRSFLRVLLRHLSPPATNRRACARDSRSGGRAWRGPGPWGEDQRAADHRWWFGVSRARRGSRASRLPATTVPRAIRPSRPRSSNPGAAPSISSPTRYCAGGDPFSAITRYGREQVLHGYGSAFSFSVEEETPERFVQGVRQYFFHAFLPAEERRRVDAALLRLRLQLDRRHRPIAGRHPVRASEHDRER